MKQEFAAGGVVAILLFTPQMLMAQSTGPYISGAIGFSQPLDADLTGAGINSSLDSDLGFGISAAVGNAYGNNWRSEAELNYRRSNVDSIGGSAGSGDTSAFGLMVNGYYDFQTDTVWTPYLGAGIGAASVSYNGVSPVGGSRIDDRDWGFAYQGIAGVGYAINDQAQAFTEYRYVRTNDLDFRTDSGVDVEAESGENRIMVGLRWSFDKPKPAPMTATPVQAPAPKPKPQAQPAPPPPPAPAPQPEIPRRYLVFFDWDKSDLTSDVRAIIALAVANSLKTGSARIETVGHADRSGTERYNLSLSQRRSNSVQAELIRLGVPAKEIVVRWKGELEPLVPTEDGVREPQNRRVEIVLN